MQKRKLGNSNLEVSAIGLTQDELQSIDEALAKIAVEGNRYPEELEKRTDYRRNRRP